MKLILSAFMLASVVIFAFSESDVAGHPGSEGFLADSLLTEADLDEIERRIEILAGELEVLLPGESDWRAIKGGESFDVPGDSKFQLRIKTGTDYCCSFVD